MVAGYKSGMTTIELAKQFQCNKGTINKLLRQHGVRITKAKAQAKLNVDKVLSMYENMHTIEDIAKYFNVSSYTINRCLKAHGVKIRGRSGQQAHAADNVETLLAEGNGFVQTLVFGQIGGQVAVGGG